MAQEKDGYVLAVDGAIPTGATADYCVMGERDGKPVTIETRFLELAEVPSPSWRLAPVPLSGAYLPAIPIPATACL